MKRLGDATLDLLPAGVRRPRLPRPAPSIVHFGLGAFHRAHMAEYTEDAADDWGIIGVTMRSADVRDALAPQDGLYTLLVRDVDGEQARVVGAVRAVLAAPENPEAVVARIADPATRIVSLTVTEKGYVLDPATRRLMRDDPRVGHPGGVYSLLHAAMRRRRDAGLGGFTVLCCDNLPANGATLGAAMLDFAAAKGDGLADWIERNVAFPSSMVDRIVPATTDADRADVARLIGLDDAAPIVTEAFKQWVVEDRFAAGRPAWEKAGVEFVDDVAPYEVMKLRILNGSHSAIAYLGALSGLTHVNEVVADPALRRFIEGLMAEAAETVPLETASYRAALLRRFANAALRHRCRQIAMDGTQKLPQRLVATIAERLARGQPIAHLAVAVAAWMRFAADAVDDPLAAKLAKLQHGLSPEQRCDALLRFAPVFGTQLPQMPDFVAPVRAAYLGLWQDHPGAVIQRTAPG
jgi:fructuronate reductase